MYLRSHLWHLLITVLILAAHPAKQCVSIKVKKGEMFTHKSCLHGYCQCFQAGTHTHPQEEALLHFNDMKVNSLP